MTAPDRIWLITKQGFYYRTNSQGYTTCFYAAGRYTMEEAAQITHPNGPDGPRDGMGYVRQDHVKRDPIDPAVLAALPEVKALVLAETERMQTAVEAAAKLGRIIGFLGDDEALIEAFREACGPDLIERFHAAIRKGADHE